MIGNHFGPGGKLAGLIPSKYSNINSTIKNVIRKNHIFQSSYLLSINLAVIKQEERLEYALKAAQLE